MRTHHDAVWRFLRRLGVSEGDADDVMQDVILILARKLDTLDEASDRSFFFGTALRVAHAGFRRRCRRAATADQELERDWIAPDTCDLVEQKRLREILDRLLGRLPYELRVVFVLYEIEGFTMAEIASLLSIPPGTAASRLRRARADFADRAARLQKRGAP